MNELFKDTPMGTLSGKVFYCDMDNVIADFDNADPYATKFRNKGFFKSLTPIMKNIEGLSILTMLGAKVYILSATPDENADKDKAWWLRRYVSFIPKENYIFVRIGENKASHADEKGILFDDWEKNIKQWNDADMEAFLITKEKTILSYIAKVIEDADRD